MPMAGQRFRKGEYHPRPVSACACGDHVWTTPQRVGVVIVSPEDRGLIAERAWQLNNDGYVGTLGEPKRRFIGVFSNEIDAACAYDVAAAAHRGQYAKLNFAGGVTSQFH